MAPHWHSQISRLLRWVGRRSGGNRDRVPHDARFLFFSVGIGALAAVGALVFRQLIVLFETLFWRADAGLIEAARAAPWYAVLLIPALGGLLAGPLITFLAPEARGPGVPHVIHAVARGGCRMRHRVTYLKTIVTSVLIGSGASVGREGPVVHIGASVGASLAEVFKLRLPLRRVCLACGAAAGISATFNAPLAGTFFAIEVILLDIQVSYIAHIVVAAVVASVLSSLLVGDLPLLEVAPFELARLGDLAIFLALGLAAGIIAIGFVRLIYAMDTGFQSLPIAEWLRPALGGLAAGAVGIALPEILGVGYATVNRSLDGSLLWTLAAVLLLAKPLVTALCLGSGMSGGILAPCLVTGAALGTLIDAGATSLIAEHGSHAGQYTLAGMAAVVAGTTLAPVTAVLTIIEISNVYSLIVPVMLACIASTLVVRGLFGYSVYELKLLRMGIDIRRGPRESPLQGYPVSDAMSERFITVDADQTAGDLLDSLSSPAPYCIPMDKQGLIVGVLAPGELWSELARTGAVRETPVGELVPRTHATLSPDDDLERAVRLMDEQRTRYLVVTDPGHSQRPIGVLDALAIIDAYSAGLHTPHALSRD